MTRGSRAHPIPLRPPPGLLHHKGDKMSFSSRFGQGSIIGVHLDTWHGTLTFFKNRKCIGEGRHDLDLCLHGVDRSPPAFWKPVLTDS